MLGLPGPRRLDQPIAVSLEGLVPAGNFYRHLEAKLDLGFVREWARGLYAERGRPSIDLVLFFEACGPPPSSRPRSERPLPPRSSVSNRSRSGPG